MIREPHRRFNPLRREWVLVSPQRTARPWQGQIEPAADTSVPQYDPTCYLCPGNERAGGVRNPPYTSTFAFDNDFPALRPEVTASAPSSTNELLVWKPERGVCRVVCFSPRHDLTLSRMDNAAVREVVEMWVAEYRRLSSTHPWMNYIQVFENRGAMMGASNPHPHCQIWATESVPGEPAREQHSFADYADRTGKCLLCDYKDVELSDTERTVCENDAFLVVVPFWAVWPFETLVVSKRHTGAMHDLDDRERDLLADILRQVTVRYDALFQTPFPYSMGFHQPPLRDPRPDLWHFHAHFYPPLLRSATIRKHMVGFELLGSPQRDVNPEDAAAQLREVHTSTA